MLLQKARKSFEMEILNRIILEFEKLEKNGYDCESDLWDDLKANRHLLIKLTEKFEQIIFSSQDEFLIDIAIWGLFWNNLEIKRDVLSRVKELFIEYNEDFEIKNRILVGLGIKYSKTNNISELEFLKYVVSNTKNEIDLKRAALISIIQIKSGLTMAETLFQNDIMPSALSNESSLQKLMEFERQI